MMKNTKRIFTLIIAAVMTASLLAGCTKQTANQDTGDMSEKTVETETRIETDENGETTVVYVEKSDDTADGKSGEDASETGGVADMQTEENGDTVSDSGNKKSGDGKQGGKDKGNSAGEKKTGSKTDDNGSETVIEIPVETQEKRNPDDAKLPEGVTINSVSFSKLDDIVSIELNITNSNKKSEAVDFSYVVMKLNNKTEILNTFTTVSVNGEKTVICSMPIEDDNVNLNVGDSITVYYGHTLIGTETVIPF